MMVMVMVVVIVALAAVVTSRRMKGTQASELHALETHT